MKKISCFAVLLTVFCLIASLASPAFAAGTVSYDGDANRFIFAPGTEQSPTSLFEGFQNVMPGDTLTEQVVIKNDTSNGVKIRVYMRSLGGQEGTGDFLSQMNLTVQQQGDSILYAAPADETAQLTDWVYLGTVYSGGEIALDVTLEVPISMGDAYQHQLGYIDWQFKIEELPVESSDPDVPKTGDDSPIALYVGMMALSLGALIALLCIRKGKKQKT